MNNPNTLDDFYRYWDEFYVAWCHCNKTKIKLLGWDIPKFLGGCPNEHEVSKKYKTIDLLPEPWWGNSGGMDQPLKSVVINFNPGSGGEKQLRKEKPLCFSTIPGVSVPALSILRLKTAR